MNLLLRATILFGLPVVFVMIIFATVYGLRAGLEVEAEYVSGVLTAQAIIFGFWAILIQ